MKIAATKPERLYGRHGGGSAHWLRRPAGHAWCSIALLCLRSMQFASMLFAFFFVYVLASYSLRSIKWMWHIILWWIWVNSCPDLLYYKPRFIVLEHITFTFSHRFVFYETTGVAGCVTPILVGKHACNDLSLIFLKKLWVKLLYASSVKKHKLW